MTVAWIDGHKCPHCRKSIKGLEGARNQHECVWCGAVTCGQCGHTGLTLSERFARCRRDMCEKCNGTIRYYPDHVRRTTDKRGYVANRKQLLLDVYSAAKTCREMASECGAEPAYVRATLRRLGVKFTTAHERRKLLLPVVRWFWNHPDLPESIRIEALKLGYDKVVKGEE